MPRRKRRRHGNGANHNRKQQSKLQPLPDRGGSQLRFEHDNQVMPFAYWCWLNSISKPTGRRIINGDSGPTIIQLSPRRNAMLSGRIPVSRSVADALGLRRTYTAK